MASRPTISVVTPAHEAADTLPVAIASLVAQTCEDWECIVVDDGSTDRPRPADVVDAFADDRMRVIEFPENLGRAKARQAGLDAARGEFLCMLDADDWYVPEKLEYQLEAAREYPDCTLVSTDTYIASPDGELRAVSRSRPEDEKRLDDRSPAASLHRWERWGRPPVSHGASMLRMRRARRAAYDTDLTRTEDMDFLLQTALGERYAILHAPLYTYTRPAPADRPARMFESLRNELRICAKYAADHPGPALRLAAELAAKMAAYRAIFALGIDPLALRSSHEPPNDTERTQFQRARRRVVEHLPEQFISANG